MGTFPSQFKSIPLRSCYTTKLVPPVLSKTTRFHIIYFSLQFVCKNYLFKGISYRLIFYKTYFGRGHGTPYGGGGIAYNEAGGKGGVINNWGGGGITYGLAS